jgi:hypothetical protein
MNSAVCTCKLCWLEQIVIERSGLFSAGGAALASHVNPLCGSVQMCVTFGLAFFGPRLSHVFNQTLPRAMPNTFLAWKQANHFTYSFGTQATDGTYVGVYETVEQAVSFAFLSCDADSVLTYAPVIPSHYIRKT